MATRHEGQRCVSLGFMRPGDSRKDPVIRLQIQDDTMGLTEMIDMTPKQFADVMSGMATWVDDGFAGHRKPKVEGCSDCHEGTCQR